MLIEIIHTEREATNLLWYMYDVTATLTRMRKEDGYTFTTIKVDDNKVSTEELDGYYVMGGDKIYRSDWR